MAMYGMPASRALTESERRLSPTTTSGAISFRDLPVSRDVFAQRPRVVEEAALSDFKENLLAGDGVNRVMWERERAQKLIEPRVAGKVDLITTRVQRPRQHERPDDVGQGRGLPYKQDPLPASDRLRCGVGRRARPSVRSRVAGDACFLHTRP